MRTSLIILCLLSPLASGCASSYMRDATPTAPPDAEECKVVIYRPSGMIGQLFTFPIYDGDKLLGFSEDGCYFEYRCAPGSHLFLSWSSNEKIVDASLAGGKTYYLRSYGKMGFVVAAAGLKPTTRQDENWAKVEEVVAQLKCRQLISEKAAEHESRRHEKVEKLRKELEEGSKKVQHLVPEDGKPETPLPLPVVSP